jgi:hypothetical protein
LVQLYTTSVRRNRWRTRPCRVCLTMWLHRRVRVHLSRRRFVRLACGDKSRRKRRSLTEGARHKPEAIGCCCQNASSGECRLSDFDATGSHKLYTESVCLDSRIVDPILKNVGDGSAPRKRGSVLTSAVIDCCYRAYDLRMSNCNAISKLAMRSKRFSLSFNLKGGIKCLKKIPMKFPAINWQSY